MRKFSFFLSTGLGGPVVTLAIKNTIEPVAPVMPRNPVGPVAPITP
jgi:hypothetical protein